MSEGSNSVIDFRKQIMSIKNFLKSKKQKYQQKKNWQKYRFNYESGISSYYRRSAASKGKKAGFLDKFIKARKKKDSLNEKLTLELENLYEFLHDLDILKTIAFIPESLCLVESAEYELFLEELIERLTDISKSLLEDNSISYDNLDFLGTLFEDTLSLNESKRFIDILED
jgi:hypothetical protein